MKTKILFLIALSLVILCSSCSKDDEASIYTPEMEAVFDVFYGKFECDHVIAGVDLGITESYEFLEHYTGVTKVKFKGSYDTETDLIVQGKVRYSYISNTSDYSFDMYYLLDGNAKDLTLFRISESDGKAFTVEDYKITVESNDKLLLYDMDSVNPYSADTYNRVK